MTKPCQQCGKEKNENTALCHQCRTKDPVRKSTICPSCGSTKRTGSLLCWNCYNSNPTGKTKHPKKPCPVCGRPMLKSSLVCASCAHKKEVNILANKERVRQRSLEPNWQLVTNDFLHQFIGLFLGEGSVSFHRNKNCDTALSVRMSIGLRCDDIDALRFIQERFGGSLRIDTNGRTNPVARWNLYHLEYIEKIFRLIRPMIIIPMRKTKEIDLVLEFIDYRTKRNIRQLSSETATDFFNRMQALREFAMPNL